MKKIFTMILAAVPFGIVAQDSQEIYSVANEVFSGSYAELSFHDEAGEDFSIIEVLDEESSSDSSYEVSDMLLADPDFDVQEDMITYTKDQKSVFFSANRKLKVKKGEDEEAIVKKSVQLHLFRAEVRENGEWVNLKMLPFNGTRHSTGHPALNEDDSRLYFVSDGPESIGKTDIFVVDLLEDGSYGEPENLGSKINSAERELYPYMDDESVLYFSSDKRTEGKELDVFATRVIDDEPGFPVRLDVPASSSKEEYVAAFRTIDTESMRMASQGVEGNSENILEVDAAAPSSNDDIITESKIRDAELIIMDEAAADERDFKILKEAEGLAESAPEEKVYAGSDTGQGYDFESDRTVYTVQIGAFVKPVNKDAYQDVTRLFNHVYSDGYNRFYSGVFESRADALAHLEEIKKYGFEDAFVLGLKGKNRFLP